MLKNLVFCLQIEPNSYELGFFVVTCDVRENSIHSGKWLKERYADFCYNVNMLLFQEISLWDVVCMFHENNMFLLKWIHLIMYFVQVRILKYIDFSKSELSYIFISFLVNKFFKSAVPVHVRWIHQI